MSILGNIGKNAHGRSPSTTTQGADGAREAATALYVECWSCFVTPKAGRVHVLQQPSIGGGSTLYSAFDEPDLCVDVATLTGTRPGPLDAVVVLGSGILEGDLTVDEMTEIAMVDVAAHLNRIWPVADASAESCGKPIGEAAYAAVLAASHRIIQCESLRTVLSAVKERAASASPDGRRDHVAMTVEGIVNEAAATKGGWLDLPATPEQAWLAAKRSSVTGTDMVADPDLGRPCATA